MQTDLANLFYAAQEEYLSNGDITKLKEHLRILRERVEIYECLREREIDIFQPIADQLEKNFSSKNRKILERALKHWISVLRYSAMAMVLNNSEYLRHRVLEWLTDIISAHEMQEIEAYIYEVLQVQLTEILSIEQLALLHPFLKLAKDTLLSPVSAQ